MLIRFVKLTLRKENIASFEQIFSETKAGIKNFDGCEHLELLRAVDSPNIFFTKSLWRSEGDLQNYRNSEFFRKVWAKTKVLFEEKAEAWSLHIVQTTV
ncbi:putative quinol monooxygenase [Eudoraea chungangensis]|uniref:putative quinol monooxygenase n=1 Tax=Eudoraea chungangensis TaxID=1481905 RepID=UPI0023EA8C22|nr:antibiotic biosynthesis monooxygenase family protein [Eudoraea chungangensis]